MEKGGGGVPSARGSTQHPNPCYNRTDARIEPRIEQRNPRCPSTNTGATSAKPALRRLSSTSSRKSPAPTAPGRRQASSFRCSPKQTARAMEFPPNPPPPPPAAAEAAAVAAAAATKWDSHFWLSDFSVQYRAARKAVCYAGRIRNTTRLLREKSEKKSSSCFHGKYFVSSSCMPCYASAPVTISSRASTHSPSNFPRTSLDATRTRALLRMRLALPESAVLYTCSFSGAPSSGSPANHTGVRTPCPFLRNVSMLRYLRPCNETNGESAIVPSVPPF